MELLVLVDTFLAQSQIELVCISAAKIVSSRPLTRIRQLGSMNVMIPLTTLVGIMTYAWPFAQTEASLIAIATIYGHVTLPPPSLL